MTAQHLALTHGQEKKPCFWREQVELLKQQLEKEQRRAATAELALAKGQHLQRLLQAAVHAVLQARGPVQVHVVASISQAVLNGVVLNDRS